MGTYAIFFRLTGETTGRMIDRPGDREAVVSRLMESVGGKLKAYYWMLGRYDGMVIGEGPDSVSTAALSVAVSSTGAFSHLETHELFDAAQISRILERAKEARGVYSPPGATPATTGA